MRGCVGMLEPDALLADRELGLFIMPGQFPLLLLEWFSTSQLDFVCCCLWLVGPGVCVWISDLFTLGWLLGLINTRALLAPIIEAAVLILAVVCICAFILPYSGTPFMPDCAHGYGHGSYVLRCCCLLLFVVDSRALFS